MCGIATVVSPNRLEASSAASAMAAALAHRGPDGSGQCNVALGGMSCALAHRRLAVVDTSSGGQQPMRWSERGLTLIFNGEIYNFRALKQELRAKGHRFDSHSDTEVLLHAYAEWKDDVMARLVGMFAFVVCDEERSSLFLARDRFGIKPLYYAHVNERFVAASEVKAILASGLVERRVNGAVVDGFLRSGAVESPATIVADVRCLEPGHWLTYRNGQCRHCKYWDLAAYGYCGLAGPKDADAVTEALTEAVQSEMIADVPLGAFLSGGIDSSAIVAIMTAAGTGSVHTVSMTFDEANYDEARYSRVVAERYGTHHREFILAPHELRAMLPATWDAMDQPSIDGVNSYAVSKVARQSGLTVALSGLGGDELFGGYPAFHRVPKLLQLGAILRFLPDTVRQAWATTLDRLTGSRFRKALRALAEPMDTASLAVLHRELMDRGCRRRLLAGTDFSGEDDDSRAKRLAEAVCGLDVVAALTVLETSTYMRDVLLRDVDAMSMAHGLEVRVPYLDHRLAEMIVALPGDVKVQPGQQKPLLVRAIEPPLPATVVNRPKMGFSLPLAEWMRVDLRGHFEDLLLSRTTRERGIFDNAVVAELWKGFLDGRQRWTSVWALTAFEHWCRQCVDATPERHATASA